ncbi:unnamed protein product [Didymodactylos carnosus]|uniref:Uncharacterized protein n=1 Tax=Didymodactylos carnosus TaxID=1234261 RepID=A0A814CFR4_9BILA|nr:unnamed protein product [Didymodactylos carnosus]CAF1021893.1 unnamed protein product [Didymodactylos carnosus]CAF3716264.1 unnamed protein product [Didymodactylos carnosus]CAF3790529.1 unnamed protein product [Didymodactylos carnosus]
MYRRIQIKVQKTFSSIIQVTVEVRLVFLKIGEIDTLKEQFQAEAFIQAKWHEPSLKGTDLTITLTTTRTVNEVQLIDDSVQLSAINTHAFIDQQEWRLHEHVETSTKLLTSPFTPSQNQHPGFSATCRAARRPGYFYWNVYFLIFFITVMAFATFSVTYNLPQNRLQLSFTLLLTAVTFKWVVLLFDAQEHRHRMQRVSSFGPPTADGHYVGASAANTVFRMKDAPVTSGGSIPSTSSDYQQPIIQQNHKVLTNPYASNRLSSRKVSVAHHPVEDMAQITVPPHQLSSSLKQKPSAYNEGKQLLTSSDIEAMNLRQFRMSSITS